MMVQVDFNLVISILAAAASIVAVAAYFNQRKRAAMEEGKHLESVSQLKTEIARHDEKIRELENGSRDLSLDVREVKTDIKNILRILEGKGAC